MGCPALGVPIEMPEGVRWGQKCGNGGGGRHLFIDERNGM